MRGGLRPTWRILAALVALVALIAPAGAQTPASDVPPPPASGPAQTPASDSAPAPASGPAQTPASDSAQATLSLSAVLNGGGAPLTGGLRWRVFAAQADPDGTH